MVVDQLLDAMPQLERSERERDLGLVARQRAHAASVDAEACRRHGSSR